MNIKNNERFKSTENKIITKTLDLIKEQDISSITVSSICKASNINRSTFYAHFEDIIDLLQKIDNTMRKDLISSFPS